DNDSFPILRSCYDKAKRFIESARRSGGRAFVHCELGMNRSITLCLAYLVEYSRMDLNVALKQILIHRPNILTNDGFKKQLVQF
ncbi:hypothetical protein HELRODRAFT_126528, partial [Helobdella robusta]|uniref:protein-tyrosine-phosphatase n=1 Tax=Helobdella robusta TaxID=6412 RepID=T1EHA1_HELRO